MAATTRQKSGWITAPDSVALKQLIQREEAQFEKARGMLRALLESGGGR